MKQLAITQASTNEAGATFSECRTWRYDFWRRWADDGRLVAFIGLNPSTADEMTNDPTVTRCIGYAKRWGFVGMHMLNLFGLRSTDPRGLYGDKNPVGNHNDEVIENVCQQVSEVILSWGNHGRYLGRGRTVFNQLVRDDVLPRMRTLKITKAGHPGHPLYLRGDIKRKHLEQDALCPYCGVWSSVEWTNELPPGGMWWVDSGSCPSCNEPVLVETECEYRPRLFR